MACRAWRRDRVRSEPASEFEQRDRHLAGGVFAEWRVGPVAADQHIVETLAQREQLVLDVEHDVLHAAVRGLKNAADGVGLAPTRRALNDGARAYQLLGKRDVGFLDRKSVV